MPETTPETGGIPEATVMPAATPETPTPEAPARTFTQAELDAVVQQRLARAKPADYDEVKAKADRLDALEAGQKSDLQKAIDARAAAERRSTEIEARANSTLKRAAILAEAARQNSTDPEVVVALLVTDESVAMDKDGNVEGAEAAVKKLLKDKPFLARGAGAGASGGQFGGNDQQSIDEKIAKATADGDYETAMRLKLAKGQGL